MRRLWPRSLLGRNSLLMILLVLVTQVLSVTAFLIFVQRPRVDDAAELIASQVIMLNNLLADVPESERQHYLAKVNGFGHPPEETTDTPADYWGSIWRGYDPVRFLQHLQTRLPEGIKVRWQIEPQRRLWFQVNIAGKPYWITLAALKTNRTTGWWSAILLSFFLALIVLMLAWLMHRRINRPLLRLAKAAKDLGEGGWPNPLPVEGPAEIRELGVTFNSMLQGLAAMGETRATVLAGVSHDIRTPLTKLQLALAMSPHSVQQQDDFQRYFADIDSILQQFIDYARGSESEPLQYGNLPELITELVHGFEGLGHEFESDLQAVEAFRWQPVGMMRLLMNLMQNAVKYGRRGFQIACWQKGETVWIAVRDAGPGIDEAEIRQITRPFSRGSRTSSASGAGLGLAIAERIAQQHQGELKLINRPSGGLEVLVSLRKR